MDKTTLSILVTIGLCVVGVVLLILVGVVVLHEPLKWLGVIGIGLALASIVLLARFA